MAELRRKPTDREQASCCDFALMDRKWKEAVSAVLNDWSGVVAEQRRQIHRQIEATVNSGNTDQLAALEVSTDRGAALLETALLRYAEIAGNQVESEARAQGVDVPAWHIPENDADALTAAAGRELLRSVARTTARLLGLNLVQSAARRAMQLIGLGQSGRQVADTVDRSLSELSEARTREAIQAAMTTAQNEGRSAVLAVAPASTYVSTELLDKNVCAPCRAVDGTEYQTLTEARAAYPAGSFKDCLGGTRCRGTFVAIWDQSSPVTAAASLEGHMPYEVVQNHTECGASEPWAVVKIATGDVVGCHESEESAMEQVKALYAAEGGKMSSESQAARLLTASAAADGKTAAWEGVLAVEGVTTGDGREFSPDALSWADLPVPLRWNKEDSHGGEPHTVAVNVGRIDKIWRDGSKIMGSGVLNLSEPDGKRAFDLIKGQYLRGVSIDADSIGDADVEYVWPDGMAEDDDADLFDILFAQPEKVIFHSGRIRAATLVDIPAFSEAYVALAASGRTAAFGAVGTHSTATSDRPWDGPANEARLDSPLTLAQARAAFAWIDSSRVEGGKIVKDACRFIHHEVSADGTPGAANLAACSTGIGVLNGGRGGTTIPTADVQGVYDHLAKHLRDAGRTPPELKAAADVVVASVGAWAGMWAPPAAWFKDPQLTGYSSVIVTPEGRVFGHVAPWGSCHIGITGTCVQAPEEPFHSHFLEGEVLADDGSGVAVGQITVGTGHAPLNMAAGPAQQHYDNTGWAVADVAVGNDHHGIWLAGAIRPNADPMRVHELRAAGRVSGDWRRIGGKLRLIGLLAVNVAGFQGEDRMRARVASGRPMALVAAGGPVRKPLLTEEQEDRMAMQRVMAMLNERVHGKR